MRRKFFVLKRGNPVAVNLEAHIILPEDSNGAPKSGRLPVRHAGDILGTVKIITSCDVAFDVDLSFEGHIRTRRDTHTCRLTKELQVQYLHANRSVRDERLQASIIHLPFKFTIPNQLVSVRADIHPDFLKLCPSTDACRSSENTSFKHHQTWISYHIKISRVCADNFLPSSPLNKPREILIVPFSYAEPPIEINYHPHQYKCSNTKALNSAFLNRLQGHLTLSAAEPDPINLLTEAPRASTTVSLKVSFSPENQSRVDVGQWRLVVQSRLRSRTFTTICKLHQAPTTTASHADPFLQMMEHKERWEIRECGQLAWKREQRAGDDGAFKAIWTAVLSVPASVSKELLPTFLNMLSARQYALVIRVSVADLRTWRALELAIPLQLIYHDHVKSLEEKFNFASSGQNDNEW
ncbi:hypothetical protein ACLOAV_010345 [Pseudogymnoascus australis]